MFAPDTASHPGTARAVLQLMSWPLALSAVAAHVVFRDPSFTWSAALCCGVLAGMALVLGAHTVPRQLPALQFMMLQYYVTMGSAVFVPVLMFGPGRRRLRISADGIEEAAFGVLLFAIIAVLVFKPIRDWVSEHVGPRIARALDTPTYSAEDTLIVRTYAFLALIAVAIAVSESGGLTLPFGSLSFPIQLLSAPPLVLGLLAWDAKVTGRKAAHVIFWVVVALNSGLGLLTGMLGTAAMPVITATVLLWTMGRRPPLALLVLVLAGISTLNIAKHQFRSMTYRNGEYVSLVQRSENWGRAIDATYGGPSGSTVSDSADSTAARLRTFAQVAQIFDWVPNRISFDGPEKWLELPLDFAPRFLWPEKEAHVLRWNLPYTLTFGIHNHRTMNNAAVTLPVVGDGYWRLGWFGVVVEAIIFGGLCATYAGISHVSSRARVVCGLSALLAHNVDQHVFANLSGLPQFVITLVIAFVGLRMAGHVLRTARRTAEINPPSSPSPSKGHETT